MSERELEYPRPPGAVGEVRTMRQVGQVRFVVDEVGARFKVYGRPPEAEPEDDVEPLLDIDPDVEPDTLCDDPLEPEGVPKTGGKGKAGKGKRGG